MNKDDLNSLVQSLKNFANNQSQAPSSRGEMNTD